MPCFPVFTRSGEVTVSVDLVADDVSLSEVQLDRLSGFHRFIFNHVLRLEKSPMTFDPERAKASYIVGPVNKGKHRNNAIVVLPFLAVVGRI